MRAGQQRQRYQRLWQQCLQEHAKAQDLGILLGNMLSFMAW